MTHPELHSLLGESLDYAGMFPPTGLALDTALANFLKYQQTREAWLLGRFVSPVERLGDLGAIASRQAESPRLRISVRGKTSDRSENAAKVLATDLQMIACASALYGASLRIEYFETALPPGIAPENEGAVSDFLRHLRERLYAAGVIPLAVFIEVSVRRGVAPSLANLAELFAREESRELIFGWKIRTGGAGVTEPLATADVAQLMHDFRLAGCPWKVTGGLHQPLRDRERRDTGAPPFGFLNLFAAAVLDHVHRLPPPQIEAILNETAADAFVLRDDLIGWHELSATAQQVSIARGHALVSFGSCSFVEPIEGLQRLGLLPGDDHHEYRAPEELSSRIT